MTFVKTTLDLIVLLQPMLFKSHDIYTEPQKNNCLPSVVFAAAQEHKVMGACYAASSFVITCRLISCHAMAVASPGSSTTTRG